LKYEVKMKIKTKIRILFLFILAESMQSCLIDNDCNLFQGKCNELNQCQCALGFMGPKCEYKTSQTSKHFSFIFIDSLRNLFLVRVPAIQNFYTDFNI